MPAGISSKVRVAVSSFSLLCVSLFLTAYSARNPGVGTLGRTVLTEITSPIFSTVETVRSGGDSVWERYFALVGVQSENEALRARVEQLESERVAALELRLENARLREMIDFADRLELKGVSAAVVGSAPSALMNGIVLNRGSANGVQSGMAVVSAKGVVGQVVSVAPHASNVLLLTDHSSGVDALVQQGRVRGVVGGLGNRKCAMRYVGREDPIQIGDTIITSGMDRVYPKGLLIGTVAEVSNNGGALFKDVQIQPSVDFSKLEEVLVITEPFLEDVAVVVTDKKAGSPKGQVEAKKN